MTDPATDIFRALVVVILLAAGRFVWDVWAWSHPRPATPLSVAPTALQGHKAKSGDETVAPEQPPPDADESVLRHWRRGLSPDEYRTPDEQDDVDALLAGEASELPVAHHAPALARPEDYDLSLLTLTDEDDEQ